MSKLKEKNCRLCLKMLDDDYNVVEDYVKEIFEVLLLKVDLSIINEPVVCTNCMKNMQEAYDFKFTCISVNVQVVSLAINRNSAELDIRDVYLNGNGNKNLVLNEDYNICRFCLQCVEKSNFNSLKDILKNSTNEMLLKCLPELDLNIIKEPVVCTTCMKSLESYYSFANKCQNTEENITKYCKVQEADFNGQIRLSSVLEFLFNSKLDCIGNCDDKTFPLKEEDNLFQNEEDTYFDINNVVLKTEGEELIIKDENQYLNCETDNNRCGEIKAKEVLHYDILTDEDSAKKHVLIHKDNTKVPMHKCNICSYTAKFKYRLKDHMFSHKASSDAVLYRCERCTFGTNRKRSLKKHMLVHKDSSEVNKYKCNLCSYDSKWKQSLIRHMFTHKDSSDIVMYKCEKCTYEAKHKDYLKKHMLIHKDDWEVTMYKCNLCSFETKSKYYLKGHMLGHGDFSDVVMYKCEKCTYEAKRKGYLMKHMLIHKDNSKVNCVILKLNITGVMTGTCSSI